MRLRSNCAAVRSEMNAAMVHPDYDAFFAILSPTFHRMSPEKASETPMPITNTATETPIGDGPVAFATSHTKSSRGQTDLYYLLPSLRYSRAEDRIRRATISRRSTRDAKGISSPTTTQASNNRPDRFNRSSHPSCDDHKDCNVSNTMLIARSSPTAVIQSSLRLLPVSAHSSARSPPTHTNLSATQTVAIAYPFFLRLISLLMHLSFMQPSALG